MVSRIALSGSLNENFSAQERAELARASDKLHEITESELCADIRAGKWRGSTEDLRSLDEMMVRESMSIEFLSKNNYYDVE